MVALFFTKPSRRQSVIDHGHSSTDNIKNLTTTMTHYNRLYSSTKIDDVKGDQN